MDVFSVRSDPRLFKRVNENVSCWPTRVEAGSNTSTVTLRVIGGDEKGSLKSETVKYGRESRERQRWQGPAACTNGRPVLSSERAPHKNQDRNCQTVINIRSWAPHQELLTDHQSQGDFDYDFDFWMHSVPKERLVETSDNSART
jgi:hypothetical protein